jgi:AbrB family looped-hinge helix DNA binding protein
MNIAIPDIRRVGCMSNHSGKCGGIAMEATIDKFGRIVIPKELRDLFGLKPGSTLKVDASTEEIILKPVSEEPPLARKRGVLVITAEIHESSDIVTLIEDSRNDRIEQIIRLSKGEK